MIKIKPIYHVVETPVCILVRSEVKVITYDSSYFKLFRLLETGLDTTKLSGDDLRRLKYLSADGVIHETDGTELTTVEELFEMHGWNSTYVQQQQAHHKIVVVNYHPDVGYSRDLADMLTCQGFDVSLPPDAHPEPTLYLNIVDRLNAPIRVTPLPAFNIKLGSLVPAMSPLLSELYTPMQFKEHYEFTRAYFEFETYETKLSYFFQMLSMSLIVQELTLFLIQGAQREIVKNIVSWNLIGPTRELTRLT